MRKAQGAVVILLLAIVAACAKPVPPDKAAYVGDWSSPTMSLRITQDGNVAYKRAEGSTSKSINAPLKEFKGNDFVVGIGPAETTFVVSAPPHRDGEVWKMTVDGVELTRKP